MLNGRWVESHEVFDSPQVSEQHETKMDSHERDAELSEVARALAQPLQPAEAKHESKTWKEIRYREVLLSQTDSELGMMQVRWLGWCVCECACICLWCACFEGPQPAFAPGSERVFRRTALDAGTPNAENDRAAEL
jgi:hypothetical protein